MNTSAFYVKQDLITTNESLHASFMPNLWNFVNSYKKFNNQRSLFRIEFDISISFRFSPGKCAERLKYSTIMLKGILNLPFVPFYQNCHLPTSNARHHQHISISGHQSNLVCMRTRFKVLIWQPTHCVSFSRTPESWKANLLQGYIDNIILSGNV